MEVKTFIEKAIEEGWKCPFAKGADGMYSRVEIGGMLIDPLAWQAVGKVEEWAHEIVLPIEYISNNKKEDGKTVYLKTKFQKKIVWKYNMHRLIDALAEGKTIEEFLETL